MSLLEFYGKECPHCISMLPLIERLEKELGVEVKKFEAWHDDANEKLREAQDANHACGGVPYFVNQETGAKICGEVDYETLKAWATGK